ncbi:hypothetical protein RJP21_04840 [Paenibacillus sp. VCA1]|uniref:hypothetical protein n=1 Tax=Paenibacillus sp. VCA1 TaxID=3039148 RepID=UPI00287133B4|nr:hypothetical protein [Paenibacillus sp. VCA1]MDR9852927.1 hypothetical protein [Paenibacillus sp. VCA1]
MIDAIYVMLINGRPYRKNGAIRTYKTRERAEKEAQNLARFPSYRDDKFEVGVFAVFDVQPVETKPCEPPVECAPWGVTAE